MNRTLVLAGLTAGLLGSTALPAQAQMMFDRIASFPVAGNAPDAEATSSEIISASDDGMTLVYSDSPGGGIGFVDITDPANPQAAGYVTMDGEPTSVVVIGDTAYAGVNTSQSFTDPSGHVVMIDMESQEIVGSCDVAGQPDSVAKSPDGSLLAVAIENERDEDLNDGEIPQLPAGNVTIFSIAEGAADCASMVEVDVTGLTEVAPSDPEPEFTDFNDENELVVSLQENNHFIIIDGESGEVISHFSAGAVDLENIDTAEDGALNFTESQTGRLREPDAIKWIDADHFASSNEGDYTGGSRGFSIFNQDGTVAYESGSSLEHITASLGHYPEGRSDAKGIEPEGMEVATFGDKTLLFVMQERSSIVAVYDVTDAAPQYVQSIPSGIGPESAVAIPSRNLLATANEEDLRGDGLAGSHVMLFEYREGQPAYPTITSEMAEEGTPIGWGALSGLVAGDTAGMLHAVSDSVYANQPAIYAIDATQSPALITDKMVVTRDGETAQGLDLEGIAQDGEGGFWLASEGDAEDGLTHTLYRVDAEGAIQEAVDLPQELLDVAERWGMEGVTVVGTGEAATLWIAIQRPWQDDPEGMVKLVSYTPASGEWGAVHYALDDAPEGAWVGLSEITAHDGQLYIVERDNQVGATAAVKKLYAVSLEGLEPAALGGELPVVDKTEVHDFMADLEGFSGYTAEKIEGFAIDADGEGFVVTDNDGVDDSSGETFFWSIGRM